MGQGITREVRARLDRDVAQMQEWYPQFRLVVPFRGHPYWRGAIQPFRSIARSVVTAVVYPEAAGAIPSLWALDPEISKRTHPFHPHLNNNGSLCTFFVPDRTWDPVRDDISRLVDLASDWLRRHVFYESAGWWPGAEAPHDAPSVLTELNGNPNAPCVCGSGKEFGTCCLRSYRQISRQLADGRLTMTQFSAAEKRAIRYSLDLSRKRLGAATLAKILPHRGPPDWIK